MVMDIIFHAVLGLLTLAALLIGYYFYIRSVLASVADGVIDDAEVPDKTGTEKFEQAVEQAYALVPMIFKSVITKKTVEKIVQKAFDRIKSFAEKERNIQLHKPIE